MRVGKTPFQYTDTKIVGSSTSIVLEKEGYTPFITSLSRSEQPDIGAIIGGIFVYVPFLWTMKYNPVHTYTLSPVDAVTEESINVTDAPTDLNKSKEEKLTELKNLFDKKLITTEDYNAQKQKILNEN